MQKNNSKIILICTIFIVVALAAGIFIGMFVGNPFAKNNDETMNTETNSTVDIPESPTEQTDQETDDSLGQSESSDEFTENGVFVLSVGERRVYLEEINYHLYQLRDYYVGEYGEEPWGVVLEDGRTVSEAAKDDLLASLIETQILVDKAKDYNIELSEEEILQFDTEAQDYIDKIGPDIMDAFGINKQAVKKVYIDNEIKLRVRSAVIEEISEGLKADSSNDGFTDEELELKSGQEFDVKYSEWKSEYEINIDEQWNNISVGSVG